MSKGQVYDGHRRDSQHVEGSSCELQAHARKASTRCRKTYDLNLSRLRALIDVAWGIAIAPYSLCICANLPGRFVFTFNDDKRLSKRRRYRAIAFLKRALLFAPAILLVSFGGMVGWRVGSVQDRNGQNALSVCVLRP